MTRPGVSQFWTAAPFLAVALACAVGAFIGLATSSYWIDELFSLFLVDHHEGLKEVLARALTDTHPPGYYFLLYEWIQAFGSTEAATRSLSAILSVAALVVLFFGLRGTMSLPARSFAVAVGGVSRIFFLSAENARNYSMSILLSAAVIALALALQRRLRSGEKTSAGLWAGFWVTGLVAEYTHFYCFLAVGMAYLYLLLQARTSRDRAICVASGLTLAGLMSVYVVALLHGSRQNLQHMWFSNNWSDIGRQARGGLIEAWSGPAFVAILLLALAPWAERLRRARGLPTAAPPPVSAAPLQLSALVIGGVLASGLAVSFLVAPSFGTRNLYVLGPFFWTIAGWMFGAVAPDVRGAPGRIFVGVLAVLMALSALTVRARLTPRTEEWRASAAVVAAEPACAGQPIPVVLPFIFGPSTPFFRKLAEERFFGRYFPQPARLHAYTPEEFAAATADPALRALLTARVRSGCPVLAWGVHDIDGMVALQLQRDIAETAGAPSARVRIVGVDTRSIGMFGDPHRKVRAFIFERADIPNP